MKTLLRSVLRGLLKGWFPKGWFWRMFPGTKTGTRVHSDVPPERKPERGRTFAFSPRTKTGKRAYSPKPPFYETPLLSPGENCRMTPLEHNQHKQRGLASAAGLCSSLFWVRKISPKFSCIKFFQIRDVPTQIPGHPGHSLSKTTEKGHLHKVFVRDIPTSGSRMSQEHPSQTLYV